MKPKRNLELKSTIVEIWNKDSQQHIWSAKRKNQWTSKDVSRDYAVWGAERKEVRWPEQGLSDVWHCQTY